MAFQVLILHFWGTVFLKFNQDPKRIQALREEPNYQWRIIIFSKALLPDAVLRFRMYNPWLSLLISILSLLFCIVPDATLFPAKLFLLYWNHEKKNTIECFLLNFSRINCFSNQWNNSCLKCQYVNTVLILLIH